jgi:hypothetical protein
MYGYVSILLSKMIIPDHIESNRCSFDSKDYVFIPSSLPNIARSAVAIALAYSFIPNLLVVKEPSSFSGQLWIDGLRCFIASGYPYQYIFPKKSLCNQKVYTITIVINAV